MIAILWVKTKKIAPKKIIIVAWFCGRAETSGKTFRNQIQLRFWAKKSIDVKCVDGLKRF